MNGKGPIAFPSSSNDNSTCNGHYISAGAGFSTSSGKNGMKLICCEQTDAATGMDRICQKEVVIRRIINCGLLAMALGIMTHG